MSATYSNKFTIQVGDVVRIIFIDERAKIVEGIPPSQATAAEVVITLENARALRDLMVKLLR